MLKIKFSQFALVPCLALGLLQAAMAGGVCDALNGTWKGSENPVGEPDAVETMYKIKTAGSKVEVATGKIQGTGDCTADGDKYQLKLKFGDVSTNMTFNLLGSDIAMFYWDNSKGAGGRGTLILQEEKK